jgi:hypothetical protein
VNFNRQKNGIAEIFLTIIYVFLSFPRGLIIPLALGEKPIAMVLGATPSAIVPPDLEEKLNKLRRVKPDYIINCIKYTPINTDRTYPRKKPGFSGLVVGENNDFALRNRVSGLIGSISHLQGNPPWVRVACAEHQSVSRRREL